jgi:predicted peptidase
LPKLIDEGRNFDCIVVSPQCPIDKYWTTEHWFDSLYADLQVKYRIGTVRIYATGISMGDLGLGTSPGTILR